MILIAQSFWRKAAATFVAAIALVFVWQTTTRDSRYAAREARPVETTGVLQAGAQLQFTATAYCKGETTSSGVLVRTGVAAADPDLLPVGTVMRIDMPNPRYSGIWTVMDTGPAVQGRIVDLYRWSCTEALAFGRRPVRVTLLRLGWNPRHSVPSFLSLLLQKRGIDGQPVAPPRPAPHNGASPPAPPAPDERR
jgi:3D (Asp-Asp-Asp) domain-containing protein